MNGHHCVLLQAFCHRATGTANRVTPLAKQMTKAHNSHQAMNTQKASCKPLGVPGCHDKWISDYIGRSWQGEICRDKRISNPANIVTLNF